MERYSRMFLHFLHALTNDRERVYTFLFGTRLTNITRYLRQRDVDKALAKVSEAVEDWSGGTRMAPSSANSICAGGGACWDRTRPCCSSATGSTATAAKALGPEMERLRKSCHRLIWLNPLLRYAGFQPKSLGMRAILPHVDDFRPAHNLASLKDIAAALAAPPPPAPAITGKVPHERS